MADDSGNDSAERTGGLWRNRGFMCFWAGQSVSLVGSQVTALALPITAAVTLGASPMQMGVLGATLNTPTLLFGLFVGVWVDRLRRRPILIAANVGRGILIASIPLAALLGRLSIEQLYAVSFAVGVLNVFFDVSYQSYLPALVRREQLIEGNSKLQASASVAFITGSGLAGVLMQWVVPPLVIALDALSYFVSVALFWLIRAPEAAPRRGRFRIWKEMGEGLKTIAYSPLLRAIVGCTATSNFFLNVQVAVRMLYVTRDLNIQPATIGFIFAVGSFGGLLAALFARNVSRRLGVGPTLILMQALNGLSLLILPAAGGSMTALVLTITAGLMLWGMAVMSYDINQLSLRQAITPHAVQGRMNASTRFVTWGAAPLLGSLAGGALGELVGLRLTLVAGGIGVLCATLWTIFSPVRALRRIPAPAPEEQGEARMGPYPATSTSS